MCSAAAVADSVIAFDTSGTERELVGRIRSLVGADRACGNLSTSSNLSDTGEQAASLIPGPVRERLLAAHRTRVDESGTGEPAISVFLPAQRPGDGLRNRLRPTVPATPGLVVARRAAIEVLLASCDPAGAAPATCVVLRLGRAHGFDLRVQHGVLSDTEFAASIPAHSSEATSAGFRGGLKQLQPRVREITRQHAADQTEWAKRFPGFGGQAPAAGSTYAGSQELHSLSRSVRFHRWMAEMLRPAMGVRVLEVGAGIGTMTRALAETYPTSAIVSIEPDPALFPLLVQRVSGTTVRTATQSTLELDDADGFDTVLYVNVLEHIEDHAAELRRAFGLLLPGGCIGIIVPALPSLYGSLDAKTGHYRRYQKTALRAVVEGAGFSITDLHYFDTVGVAPYWATIKLGTMAALSDRTTMLFDNVLVPMSKLVHRTWKSVPIGKNLLVIARRP